MDAISQLAGAAMGGLQETECDNCDGHGEIPVESDSDWGIAQRNVICEKCDGTGVVPKPTPLAILGPGGDYTTTIDP